MNMFRPKRVQDFSFARATKKFFNDRDNIQRIKHLRSIIENVSVQELKIFFTKHYSLIFHAFFDVFTSVQLELQQKVNSTHYKELQNILGVLEKILIYLPNIVHHKWQFKCIYIVIKSLLHPSNIFKVRVNGMRLFLIWFQILDNNAPKVCVDIYVSLLPIFESTIKHNICRERSENADSKNASPTPIIDDQIIMVIYPETKPVLTQNIDKEIEPDDENRYFLRYMLRYLVIEGSKIEWNENIDKKHIESYCFLFDKFKYYYLPVIFPKCSSDYSLEKNQNKRLMSIEELKSYSVTHKSYPITENQIALYQEEVIRWLAELTYNRQITPNLNEDSKSQTINTKDSTGASFKSYQSQTAKNIDSYLIHFDASENLEISLTIVNKIQQILFENPNNVNIINQLFQHAFYLPIYYYQAHFCAIHVYKSWLFLDNRPSFMRDQNNSTVIIRNMGNLSESLNESGEAFKISKTMQRIIFSNVAILFLHTQPVSSPTMATSNRLSPTRKITDDNLIHSELARRIMEFIYRKSVNSISNLDYEHLMNVLLDIGFNVLSHYSPDNRPADHWINSDSTICQFFQTLNVLLIRSNLVVRISEELWNRCLVVYSKLTHWEPLVIEWTKTMDLLMKIMSKYLYSIDMNDLPLEKTERRKNNVANKHMGMPKHFNRSQIHSEISYKKSLAACGLDSGGKNANTINYNSIGTNKDLFMDKLQHNNEVTFVVTPDNKVNDLSPLEINEHKFSDNNEGDGESCVSSSHDENSSYVSAEDSNSPQSFKSAMDNISLDSFYSTSFSFAENSFNRRSKEKTMDKKCDFPSDNEAVNLSSSGCETSCECNGSSCDMPFKRNIEVDDNNLDADDEEESEGVYGCTNQTSYAKSDSKSATLTRDESDIDLPGSANTDPTQLISEDSSRTPTKTIFRRKTPNTKRLDRNSINIEESMTVFTGNSLRRALSTDNINSHHVIIGGSGIGWTEESVVILWKRCLGLLGNVTQIPNTKNLSFIFKYFLELTESFLKMRKNMCIPNRNQTSSSPPSYVPPIEDIVPWLFEVTQIHSEDFEIQDLALKILCKITVRKHDIEPSIHHLTQFYKLVHKIINSNNENLIFPLLQYLGCNFYSQPLAGSEILIFDLIKAAEIVLKFPNSSSYLPKYIPKIEAISLLNNMLRMASSFKTIKVFDSSMKETNIIDTVIDKTKILNLLFYCVKNEYEFQSRQLSVISITLFCYMEIIDSTDNINDPTQINDIRQCILQLAYFARHDNSKLASLSLNMIRIFVNCSSQIQEKLPHIPEKIIQTLCWTLVFLWKHKRHYLNSDLKRHFTSLIFTLVDWCMILPLNELLESNDYHPKGLVHLVFSALETIISDVPLDGGGGHHAKDSTEYFFATNSNSHVDNKRMSLVNANNLYSNYLNDPLAEYNYLSDSKPVQNDSKGSIERLGSNEVYRIIRLAARTAFCNLINNIGQFPKNEMIGCLSSCVQEHHDFNLNHSKSLDEKSSEKCEFTSEIFDSNNVQLYVVNGSMLVSLVAINQHNSLTDHQFNHQMAPGGPPCHSQHNDNEFRVIIRDLCGKYCWDVKYISTSDSLKITSLPGKLEVNEDNQIPPSPPPRRNLPNNISLMDKSNISSAVSSSPITSNSGLVITLPSSATPPVSISASSNRQDYVVKLFEELHQMNGELFSHNANKPSLVESPQQNLEMLAKQQIIDQNTIELKAFETRHCVKISHPKLIDKKLRSIGFETNNSNNNNNNPSNTYICRQILTQLGFMSWKRRTIIDVVKKSKIFLHLKTLDQRRCRETHKIAVLFINWGQEDKDSVLSNKNGSLEFNNFISGLGWPVELKTHQGFNGGLDPNGRNGNYSPYYCNSTVEVMFHVSTWMPSEKPEDNPAKFKHLGNDEVMIIWSENYRDYQSNIAKTQFGDIIIIIYPLRNGRFTITIKSKKDTNLFGPLFDGAIVGEKELPSLVRATALNAGRLIRESKQHYQEHYVERAHYLDSAIKKFKVDTTYEDFAENVYGSSYCNSDDMVGNFQHEISPSTYSLDSNKLTPPKPSETTDWANSREMRK